MNVDETEDWRAVENDPPLPPLRYSLHRMRTAEGRLFYAWVGDDILFYSPLFEDADEALKWPGLHPMKKS